MSEDTFSVRPMTRAEMDIAVDWAAKEGWNPGLHDAELFYSWDKAGFFSAVDAQNHPLGFISGVAYGKHYGFVGFFIVKPELRGHRIGVELGRAALRRLGDINIGIDGVLNKVKNYQAFGFWLAHKNSRYMGSNPKPAAPAGPIDIAQVPLPQLLDYDTACFCQERHAFVKSWIAQPDSVGAALLRDEKFSGYALARKCREGFKIGPLFADDADAAELLVDSLLSRLPVQARYFLDVPETNGAAVSLAENRGMTQVFSTARMYSKQPPPVPAEKIFGITSFELG